MMLLGIQRSISAAKKIAVGVLINANRREGRYIFTYLVTRKSFPEPHFYFVEDEYQVCLILLTSVGTPW